MSETPTQAQYAPTTHHAPPTPNHAGVGGLPLTGFDLGAIALTGAVLMACGFGLRRLSRS